MKKYCISHVKCLMSRLSGALTLTALAFFMNSPLWAASSSPDVLASLTKGPPKDIINALYAQTLKEKSGGRFLFSDKTLEHALFSRNLLALLNKAETKVQPGESSPIDFDPVTNSQDPDLKSYSLAMEKEDAQNATVEVTLVNSDDTTALTGPDSLVHYDFVHETEGWKIADIRGTADDIPWSLQQILK